MYLVNGDLVAETLPKNSEEQSVEVSFRGFRGCMKLMSKQNDYLYNVELDLLDDRTNQNGWRYTNLEKHRALFAGKPLLIAYTQGGRKIGDGHNMKMVRDANGEERPTFTDADSERIIGALSDDEADIRIENRDGHTWIVGKGSIWSWYAPEAVEKIAVQGSMDISIETLVTRSHMEDDTEVEEEYIILGATILGDDVDPAVRGANIRPLSAMNAELKELKLRAASYDGMKKPEEKSTGEKDKGVKRFMNSKKLNSTMQVLFPNDRVLSVSEDRKTVALCSKADCDVRGYVFSDETEVMDAHFMSAVGSAKITLNNGAEFEVPLCDFAEGLSADVARLNSELESEKELRKNAEKALEALVESVKECRRKECKAAIRAALNEINMASEDAEQVDEKLCEEIEKDIDDGEYDECMNGTEYVGAEKACAALKARAMDAQTTIRKNSAEKRRSHFAWDSMKNNGADKDPVQNLFQSL